MDDSNSSATPRSNASQRVVAQVGDRVFFRAKKVGKPDNSGAYTGIYAVFGAAENGRITIQSTDGGLFTVAARQLQVIRSEVRIPELSEVIRETIESIPHAMRLYPEAYSDLVAAQVALSMGHWRPGIVLPERESLES